MKRFGLPAAALLIACASVAPAPPQPDKPAPYKLIEGSFTPERQPDGNTILFEDAVGLVVIDTGRHLEHQAKILEYAKAQGKPIKAIINTHWHLDHSGGNAEIRAVYPDAKLYASEAISGALGGFLARSLERSRARFADPETPEAQKAEIKLGIDAIEDRRNLLPDAPVTGPTKLPLQGRVLELNLAKYAATEGDVWIYDPATATAIAGDLVVIPAPFFDTACPDGWQRALDELARSPFTTLVPGHGPAMSRPQFEIYRTAFGNLVSCGQGSGPKQACVDGWLRDAAPFLTTEQDRRDAQELLDYYIDNILRSAEKKKELCPT